MKRPEKHILVTLVLAAMPALLMAQPSAHYVPGVEGIKGASLPPPGVYLRDYNVFYFADRRNDANGNKDPNSPKLFIYANVPRVLWITDQQVLGGFLGVDGLLPLQYTSFDPGPYENSYFGVGDLFAEATLSWHKVKSDYSIGYGVWAPTGESSRTNPTRPGFGYWTHMFTAGVTLYPDKDRKWALSALNRYEINHEDADTDTTPGHAYTLEWGVSYALSPKTDVGVAGYCQFQTTKDSGAGAGDDKDRVIAVGPEVTTVCPLTGMLISLRYLREVSAEDRLQGNTVTLTLTKRF